MDYILATHPGQARTFTFKVPNELVPHLKAGMPVLVETKKGRAVAICQTAPFGGEGADDVAKMFGAYEPVKPVVGIIDNAIREYVAREIVKSGRITVDSFTICVEGNSHADS